LFRTSNIIVVLKCNKTVSKQERVDGYWGRKSRQTFALLTPPVKFREGTREMSVNCNSSVLVQTFYIPWWGAGRPSRRKSVCQKAHQHNRRPSTHRKFVACSFKDRKHLRMLPNF